MSIINDALKKTQMSFKKPKKDDKEKAEAQPQQPPVKKSEDIVNVYEKLYKAKEDKTSAAASGDKNIKNQKPPRSDIGKHVVGIFAFIVLAVFLALSWKFLSGYEPLQDFIRSKTGGAKSSRHHIANHVPVKKRAYKDGELVLNGISDIDGQKVALINDEIYQIGESIGTKEIVRIKDGEVELREGDQVYTLSVH